MYSSDTNSRHHALVPPGDETVQLAGPHDRNQYLQQDDCILSKANGRIGGSF